MEQERVRHALSRLCRCAPGQYPGAQLISADRSHFHGERRFWASVKTDGERALLFFDPATRTPWAVNRLMACRSFHCDGQSRLFAGEGSVLDCELLEGGDFPKFVVFDVLVFAGTNVQHMCFRERLAHIADIQDCSSGGMAFDLAVKPFFRTTDTLSMFWFYAYCEASHPTDGVVFIDADAAYHPGRHWGMCKWKPAHLQTVDFLVGSDGIGRLGDYDVAVALQPPPDAPGVWECALVDAATHPPTWRPVKPRPDKDKSNDLTSYTRTLDALGPDGLTLDAIFSIPPFDWAALRTAVDRVLEAYSRAPPSGEFETEFRLGRLDAHGRWRVGVTRAQYNRLAQVLRDLPCDERACTDTLAGGHRRRVTSGVHGVSLEIEKHPLLTQTLPMGEHAVRLCVCTEEPVSGPVPTGKALVVDKLTHTYHLRDFYVVLAHRQELRPSGPSTSFQVELEWRRTGALADRLQAVRLVTSGLMKVTELVRHLGLA